MGLSRAGISWNVRKASVVAVVAAVVASCSSSPLESRFAADTDTTEVTVTEPVDDSPSGEVLNSASRGAGESRPLLFVTDRKDGDSWVASDGKEYRLGLVNAPERNEPCGPEASDFTYEFLADGFRAQAYSTDRYGRLVAEVFVASGESLNVALAETGLGNDRYLAQFRHEHPDLGKRLDVAFAAAPDPACGGGSAVAVAPVPLASTPPPSTTAPPPTPPPPSPVAPSPVAPSPAPSGCHPAYDPCVPIRGDGSGNGDANDLDCGQIGLRVRVVGGSDPYRLDADGDGSGCESYG